MKNTNYYVFDSIVIAALFLSYCLCYGFFIDFLLNCLQYQHEVTLVFRLMMTGKLDLPFSFLALFLNLFILILIFKGHAKIMLLDMNSRVLTRGEDADSQMPLYPIIDSICQHLHLKECPTIHLADVEFPNAFIFGLRRKRQNLVITNKLLTLLSEQELRAILTRQLLIIKLKISTLASTVVLISNFMLIFYDFFWFNSIYNSSSSSHHKFPRKIFRMMRFFIPIGTFWFRYFLDPNTTILIDHLTREQLPQQTLVNALLKIEQYHQNHHALMRKWYTKIRYNELRRELFILDPAEYNYAQTIALPFTTGLGCKSHI